MNTPTPETDVEAANFSDIDINDGDAAVSASFARKLERERDEAIKQIQAPGAWTCDKCGFHLTKSILSWRRVGFV